MSFIVPSTLRSWVDVPEGSHFPIQNVPLGVGIVDDQEAVLTRIGNSLINVSALMEAGLLTSYAPVVQGYLLLDATQAKVLRSELVELLATDEPKLRDSASLRKSAILPLVAVEMVLPVAEIPTFVDFYSGIYHATNVGHLFRPEAPPLQPNYRHVPVAYTGRASSIVVSGTPIIRPCGQYLDSNKEPIFAPTKQLDFEVEIGYFIGTPSEQGKRLTAEQAEASILGYVLVNDWSARDIQRWESVPLGPFLAKSFATSISPWIISPDALEPFRTSGPAQVPPPLPYLQVQGQKHFDIELSAQIQSQQMTKPQGLTTTNSKYLYWSAPQQMVHQTSNGTPLMHGDLYASGTISSETSTPEDPGFGSLLELTKRGTEEIQLHETGEHRLYLQDGDKLTISGSCRGDGFIVGFGSVEGEVVAAVPL